MSVFEPATSPFAAENPAFSDFPAIQKQPLAQVLAGLTSEQEVTALILESDTSASEAVTYLLAHMPAELRAVTLQAPWANEHAFLRALSLALDIPTHDEGSAEPVVELVARITATLNATARTADPRTLIVKDAHLAPLAVMNHLLAISSAPTEGQSQGRLHTLLIGHDELQKRLPRPDAKLPHDTKVAIHHLPDLSELDTIEHIRTRMKRAGWEGPLPFDLPALRRIHQATLGLPARINPLCERALEMAQEHHSATVTDGIVATLLGQTAPSDTAAPTTPARASAPAPQPAHGPTAAPVGSPAFSPPPSQAFPASASPQLAHQAAFAAPHRRFQPRWIAIGVASLLAFTVGAVMLMGNGTPAPPNLAQSSADNGTMQTKPGANNTTQATSPDDITDGPLTDQSDKPFPDLATLSDDTDAVWTAVGQSWGLTINGPSACADALRQGHQCFRTLDADVTDLKALDRPGLAQLEKDGVKRWLQLSQWRGDTVTLALDKTRWQLPVEQFAQLWTGRFTTFWRQPLEQTSRIFAAEVDDPAGQWLDQQLKKLQSQGEFSAAASTAKQRLVAFQETHGLPGDGKALPSTFIKVNQLVGAAEPLLSR